MPASLPRLIHAGRYAGIQDCPWHVHEGHELVLVESGTCVMTCGEEEMHCPAGTLAVLPRGVPQYQRSLGEARTSYAVWQAGDAVLDPSPRLLTLATDARPARWLRDLCDMYADPDHDPAVADALLLALLTALGRSEVEHRRDAALHPALVEATRLLAYDLPSTLDVGRLAERVGLSAAHLARLFRRSHGCPPLRYQHRLRLRLAERLLQDPMLTVAEVGRRCGWDDLNYFCRVFRKHAGMAPGVWRGARRM